MTTQIIIPMLYYAEGLSPTKIGYQTIEKALAWFDETGITYTCNTPLRGLQWDYIITLESDEDVLAFKLKFNNMYEDIKFHDNRER